MVDYKGRGALGGQLTQPQIAFVVNQQRIAQRHAQEALARERENAAKRKAEESIRGLLKTALSSLSPADFAHLEEGSALEALKSCLAAAKNNPSFPQSSSSPVKPKESTYTIDRVELDAVAKILGQSSETLKAAFDHVIELQSRGLPISLPEKIEEERKFANRKEKDESIIDFLRREWGGYMKAGLLTRPSLRALDPSAVKGIDNWLYLRKPLPADIKVPTLEEVNDSKLADKVRVREAERLMGVKARRAVALKP